MFALDRKIYRGVFQAKGLRLKVLDQSDNTVVLDTSLQFNVKAADSIKAAVKF